MREPLRLTLTTAPALAPLSLNEIKSHLRLDDDQTSEDALLTGYAGAAAQACERFTGRALITQTWTLFRDRWPAEDMGREPWWDGVRDGATSRIFAAARALELPKPPLRIVVHVKTYDDDDTESIYPAANYFVDGASVPGRLVLRDGATAPNPTRAANGLEIRFTAGYGDDPADLPEDLRSGLFLLIAHLYEQREVVTAGAPMAKIPAGVEALWQPFRVLGP